MALVDKKGDKLPGTYTVKHWEDFKKIKGLKLHSIFIFLIEYELSSGKLNSRIIGEKILSIIDKINPVLLKNQGDSKPNQLFGMTLWNFLESQDETWKVKFFEDCKEYTLISI